MHYVFNPDHYIGIVIANTTLVYNFTMGMLYFFYGEHFTVSEEQQGKG